MANKEAKSTNKKEKNTKNKTSYFKSFKAELKKVSWPTPKQLINNTIAVVVIVVVLSAIVFVLDLAFESVNKYGIDKIKESVVSSSQSNTIENNTNSNTDTNSNTSGNNITENKTTESNNTTTQNNQ